MSAKNIVQNSYFNKLWNKRKYIYTKILTLLSRGTDHYVMSRRSRNKTKTKTGKSFMFGQLWLIDPHDFF